MRWHLSHAHKHSTNGGVCVQFPRDATSAPLSRPDFGRAADLADNPHRLCFPTVRTALRSVGYTAFNQTADIGSNAVHGNPTIWRVRRYAIEFRCGDASMR